MPIAHSNFGFAVNAAYYNNPVNQGGLNDASDKYMGHKNEYRVSATPYNTMVYTGGVYMTLPVHKFSFDFKALAGVAKCSYPTIVPREIRPPFAPSPVMPPATTAFAYNADVTARYHVKKHFCIFAQVGFFATKQEYSVVETMLDTHEIKRSNPMTVMNISAGVGRQF